MLTQIQNRETTNDVDVLLKNVEDPTSLPYRTLKAAIRATAKNNKLSGIWFNDVIGDFIRGLGTAPEGVLWRTYGKLEIFLPPKEYILALKLLANRKKDKGDIAALCQQLQIQTREQAQTLLDRYVPDKKTQQINKVSRTLNQLFPAPKPKSS